MSRSRVRGARAVLGAGVMAALLCACGGGSEPAAFSGFFAFGNPSPGVGVLPGVRPGTTFSLIFAEMRSHHDRKVVIQSIDLTGEGVGSVVHVEQVSVVPGGAASPFPDGVYETDPPVRRDSQGCVMATVQPPLGYLVKPGATIRLYAIITAAGGGRYRLRRISVIYSQGGADYLQRLPIQLSGGVTEPAPMPHVTRLEKPCLGAGTTRLVGGG